MNFTNDLIKCKTILNNKVINCFYLDKEECGVFSNLDFILRNSEENYEDNAPICVKNIFLSYDDIGLVNNELIARFNNNNIILYHDNPISIPLVQNSGINSIYKSYTGMIKPMCSCCSNDSNYFCGKLYESNISLFINNLVITIEGTIGCRPFTADYRYTGAIS